MFIECPSTDRNPNRNMTLPMTLSMKLIRIALIHHILLPFLQLLYLSKVYLFSFPSSSLAFPLIALTFEEPLPSQTSSFQALPSLEKKTKDLTLRKIVLISFLLRYTFRKQPQNLTFIHYSRIIADFSILGLYQMKISILITYFLSQFLLSFSLHVLSSRSNCC